MINNLRRIHIQTKYGYLLTDWENAKLEMMEILIKLAKVPQPIFYGELVKEIDTIQLEPNSYALFHMLGEISEEENFAGRGMLSAMVINRDSGIPGQGFFDLAESLGKDTSDKDKCWTNEFKEVHNYWKSKS